ncbi:MAG: replication terminator protein [Deltaproteobacteria bacterium HGW-Deltaproteobacteria-6]|nr:MAG: replication terminator protein [Deltaproteobacteria bacterium HGW-Deltaproteobacteria-6]
MEKETNVTLESLNQGAALERFNLALQDVLDNIQDPNTDPKTTRTVTLKVTFKPDSDRGIANLKCDVVPKLAPIAPFDVRVFLGRDKDGKGYASEYHSNQAVIPGTEAATVDNVYKLDKKEAITQ